MMSAALRVRVLQFARDARGSVAVVFAVVAVGLLCIVALGIDAGRAYVVRAQLQGALDAAVLAEAAKGERGEGASTVASTIFYSKPIGQGASVTSFNIGWQGDNAVGTATAVVPVTFGSVLGGGSGLNVSTRASARIASGGFTDVHFIVDVSESMNIAATPDDITRLQDITRPMTTAVALGGTSGCAFGCHFRHESNFEPPGKTMAIIARENDVQLRADVVREVVVTTSRSLLTANSGARVAVAHFSDTFDPRLTPTNVVADVEFALGDVRVSPLDRRCPTRDLAVVAVRTHRG